MPAHRLVSQMQLEKIITIMEIDRDLAMGRLNNTPLGKQENSSKWQELASQLNSVGEGTTKSATKWREYWNEKKYATKKKAAQLRLHATGTGGGPPKGMLTDLEQRILNIMGPVAVFGEPAARIPFNVEEPTIMPPPPSSPIVEAEKQMEVQSVAVEIEVPEAPSETTPRNSSARRRRQPTGVDESSAPQWAVNMENRRVDAEVRMAKALEDIAKALTNINNTLLKIENKIQ